VAVANLNHAVAGSRLSKLKTVPMSGNDFTRLPGSRLSKLKTVPMSGNDRRAYRARFSDSSHEVSRGQLSEDVDRAHALVHD
jgi:hypothetical protein